MLEDFFKKVKVLPDDPNQTLPSWAFLVRDAMDEWLNKVMPDSPDETWKSITKAKEELEMWLTKEIS